MTNSQFFTQLGLVTLFSVLVLLGLYQIPKIAPYQLFGWISLIVFFILTILMYFAGKKTAVSSNKNTFTNTVLGFTMGKMFLSIIVVFSYLKLSEPGDKFFIAPFFAIYFIYTAFETYLMLKLGRTGV